MHNTKEQNEAFRKTFDATTAYWKAQQKAFEADPEAYKKELQKVQDAQKSKK